ncbi:MAG: phage holin family protein [Chloroflexi bacterium]|nr:MAG: phage holin family protein [Chloroflexota bacterium]
MDSSPRASATDSARTAANGNGRHGLIDLARVAVEDTVRLVQQEIQLAKIEVREMLSTNIRGAAMLAAAGLSALLCVVMLLVALIEWIPNHVLAALVAALIFAIICVVLIFIGKGMLKIGPPPKTMTTLKEDAEWAKQVLKRNGK